MSVCGGANAFNGVYLLLLLFENASKKAQLLLITRSCMQAGAVNYVLKQSCTFRVDRRCWAVNRRRAIGWERYTLYNFCFLLYQAGGQCYYRLTVVRASQPPIQSGACVNVRRFTRPNGRWRMTVFAPGIYCLPLQFPCLSLALI